MGIQLSPQALNLQQQALGMPPDQMQALLNQQVGLIPMPELLAIKNAVDRSRLKGAPPRAQPEQTTVAQDLMVQKDMQDRMQGGVAGLPVANVGNEDAYAGGGIVAFTEGGGTPFGRAVDTGLGAIGRGMEARRSRIAQDSLRNRLMRELVSRYQSRAAPEGMFATQSDAQQQEAQDLMQRLSGMSIEEMQAALGDSAGSEQGTPQYGLGAARERQFGPFEQPPPQIRQFGETENMPEEKTERRPPAPPPAPEPERQRMTAPTEADFGITPESRAMADKDVATRIKEAQAARGEDVLAKQEGDLKAQREERVGKTAQTKDMWMALSQGFFDMAASGSPTFSGALAAGAQRGFDSYRQAIAKRDDIKDRYDDKLAAVERAKAAQAEGDYRYASADRKSDQAELNSTLRAVKTSQLGVEQFEIGRSDREREVARTLAARQNEADQDREARAEENRLTRKTQMDIANIGFEKAEINALASAESRGAMTDKQRGDTIREIQDSPEVAEYAQSWLDGKGKGKRGTDEYNTAIKKKIREIYDRDYGRARASQGNRRANPIYDAADSILGE